MDESGKMVMEGIAIRTAGSAHFVWLQVLTLNWGLGETSQVMVLILTMILISTAATAFPEMIVCLLSPSPSILQFENE